MARRTARDSWSARSRDRRASPRTRGRAARACASSGSRAPQLSSVTCAASAFRSVLRAAPRGPALRGSRPRDGTRGGSSRSRRRGRRPSPCRLCELQRALCRRAARARASRLARAAATSFVLQLSLLSASAPPRRRTACGPRSAEPQRSRVLTRQRAVSALTRRISGSRRRAASTAPRSGVLALASVQPPPLRAAFARTSASDRPAVLSARATRRRWCRRLRRRTSQRLHRPGATSPPTCRCGELRSSVRFRSQHAGHGVPSVSRRISCSVAGGVVVFSATATPVQRPWSRPARQFTDRAPRHPERDTSRSRARELEQRGFRRDTETEERPLAGLQEPIELHRVAVRGPAVLAEPATSMAFHSVRWRQGHDHLAATFRARRRCVRRSRRTETVEVQGDDDRCGTANAAGRLRPPVALRLLVDVILGFERG